MFILTKRLPLYIFHSIRIQYFHTSSIFNNIFTSSIFHSKESSTFIYKPMLICMKLQILNFK